jgi:uncharacterized repeat protein (TIGR02543 family)
MIKQLNRSSQANKPLFYLSFSLLFLIILLSLTSCDPFFYGLASRNRDSHLFYTITFDVNGGKGGPAKNPLSVIIGGSLASWPAEPTHDANYFTGWHIGDKNSSEIGERFNRRTIIDKNIKVYARWEPKIVDPLTVTFDENGGATPPEPKKLFVGAAGLTLRFLPEEPIRTDDHLFTGWFTEKTGGERFSLDSPVNGNITVYAQWEKILPTKYLVTFDRNGGQFDASPRQVSVTSGDKVDPLPNEPKWDIKTFDKWNTKPDGTGIEFTSTSTINENITVYAQWTTIVNLEVTFNTTNEAKFTNNTIKDIVEANPFTGKLVTSPLPLVYNEDDWVLDGWFLSSTAKGKNDPKIIVGVTLFGSDTEVWAGLTKYLEFTVTFMRNHNEQDTEKVEVQIKQPKTSLDQSHFPTSFTPPSGKKLGSWHLDKNASGEGNIMAGSLVNSDMTVFAVWVNDD